MQASDSSSKGYLAPSISPAPLQDDALVNFFQEVIVGLTNFDPTLIRPRWQPEPPTVPTYPTDWCAFGTTYQESDIYPAVIHDGAGNGKDLFQTHETIEILVSFYGNNSGKNASLLRDGLFIDQNRDQLREAGLGLLEIDRIITAPEEDPNNQWWNRSDISIRFRREIRRDYPILNLISAQGTIISDESNITVPFNTENQ